MTVLRPACRSYRKWHGFLCAGIGPLIFFLAAAGRGDAFERPSSAGPFAEIRIGLAAHDMDGLWSGSSKENGPDVCAEAIFDRSLFDLLYATARPNLGVSLNTRGDTSKLYGGVLLQWESAWPILFSTGIGLALHNGECDTDRADRKSLGSQVLFRVPIEIGYAIDRHHRIVVAFDHVSNAGLASPNEGLDTLGLFYGYRF
ncbi:MAG: acyloxyacyl hydrolase [Desulfosarcina sp.]